MYHFLTYSKIIYWILIRANQNKIETFIYVKITFRFECKLYIEIIDALKLHFNKENKQFVYYANRFEYLYNLILLFLAFKFFFKDLQTHQENSLNAFIFLVKFHINVNLKSSINWIYYIFLKKWKLY